MKKRATLLARRTCPDCNLELKAVTEVSGYPPLVCSFCEKTWDYYLVIDELMDYIEAAPHSLAEICQLGGPSRRAATKELDKLLQAKLVHSCYADKHHSIYYRAGTAEDCPHPEYHPDLPYFRF